MAKTGSVKVRIDDETLRKRVNELSHEALAEAWDQGFKASEQGSWCTAHDQTDWCDYGKNPYRP